MARLFDGSDDYGQIPLDLSRFSAISISVWLYWNAYANNNDLMLEFTATTNTAGAFTIIPNDGGGSFAVYIGRAAGSWGDRFPRPSAAVWHHYLFEMDRGGTTRNRVWVDGLPQTLTAGTHTDQSGTFFANSNLNIMARNASTTLSAAGRMADLAIWGGVLSGDADAATLARGVSPLRVRPDRLACYLPLEGAAANREPAYGRSGVLLPNILTVSGALGTAHPFGHRAVPRNRREAVFA